MASVPIPPAPVTYPDVTDASAGSLALSGPVTVSKGLTVSNGLTTLGTGITTLNGNVVAGNINCTNLGATTLTTGTATNAITCNGTARFNLITMFAVPPIETAALYLCSQSLPATTIPAYTATNHSLQGSTFTTNGVPSPVVCYTASGGHFLAPIAGIYHFAMWLRLGMGSNNTTVNLGFQKNATDAVTNMLALNTNVFPSGGDQPITLNATTLLTAGDYVSCFLYSASSGSIASENTNGLSNFTATLLHCTG